MTKTHTPIPVSEARHLATNYGKDTVVIVAGDKQNRRLDFATFGVTAEDKVVAVKLRDRIAEVLLDQDAVSTSHEDFRADYAAALQKEGVDILRRLEGNPGLSPYNLALINDYLARVEKWKP